jgi:hypothetical protein
MGGFPKYFKVVSSTFLCFPASRQRYAQKPRCQAITIATGSAKPHARQHEITKQFGFYKAVLNHQRDNMQEAPAPAILPLDSTPNGTLDGNPSGSAATAGNGMADVLILMSPSN